MSPGERQEVEVVRGSERLSGEVAFRLRQRGFEVVDRLAFPQVRIGFDLVGEDGSRVCGTFSPAPFPQPSS